MVTWSGWHKVGWWGVGGVFSSQISGQNAPNIGHLYAICEGFKPFEMPLAYNGYSLRDSLLAKQLLKDHHEQATSI